MSEFILFLVIVSLSGLIGWQEYQNRKERTKLINAVMSKTAQDLVNFDLAEKVEIKQTPIEEDFTAVEDLSDKEFDKHILGKDEQNG